MRMHFPAVIMIAVIGRIENEWLGRKLTIDDSKSFTNYVHVVTWFPESFSVDEGMNKNFKKNSTSWKQSE